MTDECADIYEAIDSLYATVQDFHRDESFPDTPDPQHPHLVPTLKPYQCKAVRWMISRESKGIVLDDLLPSTTTKLPTGGILADEMGLGKTVEVLACILLNPRKFTDEDYSFETNNQTVNCDDGKDDPIENQPDKVKEPSPRNSYSKRKKRKSGTMNNDDNAAEENENDNVCNNSKTELNSDFSVGGSTESQSRQEDILRNEEVIQGAVESNIPFPQDHCGNSNSFSEVGDIKSEPLENNLSPRLNGDINCDYQPEKFSKKMDGKHHSSSRDSSVEVNSRYDEMETKFLVSKMEVDPLEKSTTTQEHKPENDSEEVSNANQSSSENGAVKVNSSCEGMETKFVASIKMEVDSLEVETPVHESVEVKRPGRKRKSNSLQKIPASSPPKWARKSAKKESIKIEMEPEELSQNPVSETAYETPINTPASSPPKRGRKSAKKESIKIEMEPEELSQKPVSETPSTTPGRKKSVAKKSATFQALNAWYEELLAEVKPKARAPVETGSSLHCFCDKETNRNTVQCVECKFYQHKPCVNFDSKKMRKEDYLCPSCITKQKPIQAKTTFIVSPASISDQWLEEIEKHTNPRLKVLKYETVRSMGYLQPTTIAEYDIVLTTYQSLAVELNYVPDECNGASRTMRHAKRYFSPQSPLLCLEWWRICLDEAQMVESINSKPSQMTQKLSAVHRWAVTGTPIQKTVDDIRGLIDFLGLTNITAVRAWRELRAKNDTFLYFLGQIMWRHSKHEVIHEFGVPPQTVQSMWLKFSAIESHFYNRQHTQCSDQFLTKVSKYSSLNIPLQSIDRKEVSRILQPLLALRQACSHPQAVRGKLLSRRATMTMAELLDVMVKKTQVESEDFLRQYICALNGLAGLHLIIDEVDAAIEYYREILQLCQSYEGTLHADTLQRIHTLYNLAEVLELKPDGIAPTLRDTTAKEDAAKLEQEYLDKKRVPMANTRQQVAVSAAEVAKLCNGATLGFSNWWLNIIDWAPSNRELITQLKNAIANDSLTCIASKITSKVKLKAHLATWLADMDSLRCSIIQNLHMLEATPTEDLVHKALCCHLRRSKKSNKLCPLCDVEQDLKTYESLLFMVSSKVDKTISEQSLEDEKEMEEEMTDEPGPSTSKKNSSLEALKEVKLFEVSWKGSWKNSQILSLLSELSNFGRSKGAPAQWLSEAKQHLKLMDVVKREFKKLRLLWTQNSELVQGCDELVMAKMRLRLRLETDTPKKKLADKMDHIHLIDRHQIHYEFHRLKNESKQAAEQLKRKSGTLLYLKNLQKEKSEDNVCPICRGELKDKWAVLVCGHCICFECTPTLIHLSQSENVECAVCREKSPVAEISFVDCQGTVEDNSVKGSYSTKIEGVIRLVQSWLLENSSLKILVFSSWEKVLDILQEGFEKNNITFERLKSGPKYKNSVKNFKSKEDTNVLLLQFKSGAKGLNLTEATHIILVEPVLNPSDELQAVGRVHRMGQTKPTFVHRLVIENTIEEKMLSAVKESEINQWRKNQVTLQQLSQLFTHNVASSGMEPVNQSVANSGMEPVNEPIINSGMEPVNQPVVNSDTEPVRPVVSSETEPVEP